MAASHSASPNHHAWWAGIPGEEHVAKLDLSNYDALVANRNAFIMYFARWCGYSQNARAAFAATAAKFAKEGNSVLFGAVDCDDSKGICARYQECITGFPSFVYLYAGGTKHQHLHPYRHSTRTLEAFHNWIIDLQTRQHEHEQEHKHHNVASND
ncbi:Protein disulfide-isomerase 1 [Orchesella cincta]|uniref:Protein disulfide-isomerase 1 n=1 Tax=Orchesella cincta TaxID=48709 RepID=A0A1D2NLH5_ORCCI|nr:Protein disulfide-isomerase 1 [Orchesella cincta]